MPWPWTTRVIARVAASAGVTVIIERRWGHAGLLRYPGGRNRFFRKHLLDLNTVGAYEIAKDKGYAAFFLRRLGYPVPRGRTFLRESFAAVLDSRDDVNAACNYAQRIGWPVFVKPNSGSQGRGVALVSNERELRAMAVQVFEIDRAMLVQKPVPGRDFRLLVLDNEVLCAYERRPFSVVGDGRSTVRQLIEQKLRALQKSGRDIELASNDLRIRLCLGREVVPQSVEFEGGPPPHLIEMGLHKRGGPPQWAS